MNLTLSLRYQEQNDNKAIVLTDSTVDFGNVSGTTTTAVTINKMYRIAASGTYNFVALGAANNNVGTRFVSNATTTINLSGTVYEVTPTVDEITAATLAITVKDVSGASIVKPTINLYTTFDGPFADQDEMVYTITAALMGDTADSLLVDGLYTLVYTLTSKIGGAGSGQIDTLTVTILVYGQVKIATYQKLRQIPTTYACNDGRNKDVISEADLCGAYLTGIENSAYIAKTEELLNMLTVLDNMILNGSNITW